MSLIENIKSYFKKKTNNQEAGAAPEGVCPNCWGKQDWDGEHYTFMKGQNSNPSNDTYTNFVKDVARKLDKIVVNKDNYVCETCKVHYERKK
jgi:hypothetical protein